MICIEQTIQKYNFDPQVSSGNKMKICVAKCDFCEDVFEKQLYYILRGRKKILKDSCMKKECINKKQSEIYASLDQRAINEKRNQTNLERYGFENSFQNPDFQEKQKQTMLEKYGVEKPLQVKIFKQKQQQTMLDSYGTLSSLEASGRKEEIISALKNKSEITVIKTKSTMIERYGQDNASKIPVFRDKRNQTNLKKYGTIDVLNLRREITNRISEEEIKIICSRKGYEILFSYSEYKNNRQLLLFKCNKHPGKTFKSNVFYLQTEFNQCPRCRNYKTSKAEKEIQKFIDDLGIQNEKNTREIITPYELDVYIPEKNIAIEHNGLYPHSETCIKNKKSHYNKFINCKNKNILLFQVLGDEWRDKKDIWKSIFKTNLGIVNAKTSARKLIINKTPEFNKIKDFVNENHLSGHTKYIKSFSLENDQGEILICLTLRWLFTKKDKETVEIARLCTKKNTLVVGGFSRLIKYVIEWCKENNIKKIITYSDCRYSWGKTYQKYGFSFVRHAYPDYYYTDWINRFNRFKFRAKNGSTERQIARENGVYRIYGPGHYRWELKI